MSQSAPSNASTAPASSSAAASKPRIQVPDSLREILLEFSIAYLLEQPGDVVDYAVDFFTKMQERRKPDANEMNNDHHSEDSDIDEGRKMHSSTVSGALQLGRFWPNFQDGIQAKIKGSVMYEDEDGDIPGDIRDIIEENVTGKLELQVKFFIVSAFVTFSFKSNDFPPSIKPVFIFYFLTSFFFLKFPRRKVQSSQ